MMKVSASIPVYEAMSEAGRDTMHCSSILYKTSADVLEITAPICRADHETMFCQTDSGTDGYVSINASLLSHPFSFFQRWYASLLNLCGF